MNLNKLKKYIPFYGIKYSEADDFTKMLIYHNLWWMVLLIAITELKTKYQLEAMEILPIYILSAIIVICLLLGNNSDRIKKD